MNKKWTKRRWLAYWLLTTILLTLTYEAAAQSHDQMRRAQVDSALAARYYRQNNIDTAYVIRPQTKWTVKARLNFSGSKIKTEGITDDLHFNSEMTADYKTTISLAVSYLGVSLSASLNPRKLMGKYKDYELNFTSYGKRFGFDVSYQDAKNYTGWHDMDGMERIDLPADMLSVKTLNVNAYYCFNSRRFSYPAAFSQSYIQRQSAGSFLLAISGQGQHATLKPFDEQNQSDPEMEWKEEMNLKMTNIGIGGGYGYNYVPSKGWLLHVSALPTFIVYSNTSMKIGDDRVPLHYHFPEAIITGRGAVVRNVGNKFYGMSMVFNFTNIGHKDDLAIHNIRWRVRAFFGLRL